MYKFEHQKLCIAWSICVSCPLVFLRTILNRVSFIPKFNLFSFKPSIYLPEWLQLTCEVKQLLSGANEGNTSDKRFKLSFVNACVISACIHIPASFHVDTAVKELQTIEVEEPEAEYQEQPESEFEIADQASKQDFDNFETQQGKPRCI